jgi:predicted ATPase
VFLTPPWPEIYVTDADRRHQLSNAVEEYDRLLEVYSSIGYKVLIVPKTSVKTRADFVLEQLAQ